MRIYNIFLSMIALMFFAVSAAAEQREVTHVSSTTRQHGTVEIPVTLVFLEQYSGKLPVMVLVHSSGGVHENHEFFYAKMFAEMGIASAVIDSFGPRHVKSTIRNQLSVVDSEMMIDAFNVLHMLWKDKRFDRKRIGIIGWSKGGTVALDTALADMIEKHIDSPEHFAFHIAAYPGCSVVPAHQVTDHMSVYVFLGKDDTYTGADNCLYRLKRLLQDDPRAQIKQIIYDNAQHGFDLDHSGTDSKGDSYRHCRFLQQPNKKSWVEQTSGITTWQEGRSDEANHQARMAAEKVCVLKGVSWGGTLDVREKFLTDVKEILTKQFKLESQK